MPLSYRSLFRRLCRFSRFIVLALSVLVEPVGIEPTTQSLQKIIAALGTCDPVVLPLGIEPSHLGM